MPTSKRRERELARRRYERRMAAREQARARSRRRNQRIAAALAVLVVIGGAVGAALALTGGSPKKKSASASAKPQATASASPSASASAAPGTCTYTRSSAGKVKFVGLPPQTGVNYTTPEQMTMVTNRGTIKIALDASQAPCTVNSFAFLASKHYFDNTPCHRLTTASGLYVLQCGDPTGTGTGGPGYTFPDENLKGATYPAGTVAMANSGPNTNGSQFFLVYKDSQLPPSYTPFGHIVSGMSVLTTVAAGGTDNANGPGDGHPKLPVEIKTLSVAKT